MRRWAMTAAIVLTLAGVVCCVLLSAFHAPEPVSDQPRMTAMGLLLLDDEAGLYVLGVMDGSVAGNAGIQPGDYLTAAGGATLTSTSQLEELLAEDRACPITLDRQSETITIDLAIR